MIQAEAIMRGWNARSHWYVGRRMHSYWMRMGDGTWWCRQEMDRLTKERDEWKARAEAAEARLRASCTCLPTEPPCPRCGATDT